ncbi:MAG: TM2 domain-containing protein [Clostridia bacterium]
MIDRCSNCGAPRKDMLNKYCPYCNTPYSIEGSRWDETHKTTDNFSTAQSDYDQTTASNSQSTQSQAQPKETLDDKFERKISEMTSNRRIMIGLFAIFFGWFGLHYFLRGAIFKGVLCCVFLATGIPAIIGVVEGCSYLLTSDQRFREKYPQYYD